MDQTAISLHRGPWKSVAYNLVMKFDVSDEYLVARAQVLNTDVSIDFLGMHISPEALAEPRSLNLVSMCREFLMQESDRIGEELSGARIEMRLLADNQICYDVALEIKATSKRIAGALRRVGPLKYEWLKEGALQNKK